MKYLVLEDSTLEPKATKGTYVYGLIGSDYGHADTAFITRGWPHITVTLNPDGSYPGFVISAHKLQRVTPV